MSSPSIVTAARRRSFANPAVTLARALTDSFTGIRVADVPGFVAAQCLGAASATALSRWMMPELSRFSPSSE